MRIVLALWLSVNAYSAPYYLDERGDDRALGNSPETAWATLEKLNTTRLHPGDAILLKGGNTFEGELRLEEHDSGSRAAPVIVESFGGGLATLNASNGNALHLKNAGHVVISNIRIIGKTVANSGYGVLCENTLTNGMLDGLTIANLEVSGFGKHGIMVAGAPYGFTNVTITNCSMFNNLKGGMEVAGRLAWDAKHYAHANVLVTDCRAYDNPGDKNFYENHSGSGIILYQVDAGVIERCRAWGNGAACPAKGGGPVGIWTCASRRVVIQHCESFGNLSKGLDGGGFDIDGGSEECVLQYNYSHDNRGPGLMVYTYEYASHRDRDTVVRFNISINDAQNADRYAGIWIRADGRPMTGVKVYNNTVFTTTAPAAWIHGSGVGVELRNNILVSGTGVPIQVDDAQKDGQPIVLRNNLYWRSGKASFARLDGQDVNSISEWPQKTGQRLSNSGIGVFVDPAIPFDQLLPLKSPLPDLKIVGLLRPSNSAAQNAGVSLDDLQNTDGPFRDFCGIALPSTGGMPVGAVATPAGKSDGTGL